MKTREAAQALQIEEWQLLAYMIRSMWITTHSTHDAFGLMGRRDKVQDGYLVNITTPRQGKRDKKTVEITPAGLDALRQRRQSIISGETQP